MKYIIVDDEDVNLIIAKRLLFEVLGEKDVTAFTAGREALRYLQDLDYKDHAQIILFLDLNMPMLSGWDFLEFFDQFDNELKSIVHIYIVSSSINPNDRSRALLKPNVISFVSKPLTKTFIIESFKEHQNI